MKQTIVVGIHAGACAGKSTLAAELFVELKKQGKSVELVREYVKDWAYRGISPEGLPNSIYIFAKQLRAESTVYGLVDYIVTDCPLGLSVAYESFYEPGRTVIWDLYKAVRQHQAEQGVVKHLDFHLMRQFEYKKEGRYESEEEARRVDQIIRQFVPASPVKCAKDILEVLAHVKRDSQ